MGTGVARGARGASTSPLAIRNLPPRSAAAGVMRRRPRAWRQAPGVAVHRLKVSAAVQTPARELVISGQAGPRVARQGARNKSAAAGIASRASR